MRLRRVLQTRILGTTGDIVCGDVWLASHVDEEEQRCRSERDARGIPTDDLRGVEEPCQGAHVHRVWTIKPHLADFPLELTCREV